MDDKTEAMDNLIAQDADLLDAEGVKLYWYRQGKDDGVEQERAKIVAWCRNVNIYWCKCDYAIEAGEHLQEQNK